MRERQAAAAEDIGGDRIDIGQFPQGIEDDDGMAAPLAAAEAAEEVERHPPGPVHRHQLVQAFHMPGSDNHEPGPFGGQLSKQRHQHLLLAAVGRAGYQHLEPGGDIEDLPESVPAAAPVRPAAADRI